MYLCSRITIAVGDFLYGQYAREDKREAAFTNPILGIVIAFGMVACVGLALLFLNMDYVLRKPVRAGTIALLCMVGLYPFYQAAISLFVWVDPRRRLHHIHRCMMHFGKVRGDAIVLLEKLKKEDVIAEAEVRYWGLKRACANEKLKMLSGFRTEAKQELDVEQKQLRSYLEDDSE